MPKDNKKDLEDIPKYIRKDLQFIFVEHLDEVLKVALTNSLPQVKKEKEEIKKESSFVLPLPTN